MFRTGDIRVNPVTGVENVSTGVGTATFSESATTGDYGETTIAFGSPVDFRVNDILILSSYVNLDDEFTDETPTVRVVVTAIPATQTCLLYTSPSPRDRG